MLRKLLPDLRLRSVLELEPDRLAGLGIRGLLLDLDCTLKDHFSDQIAPEILDWIEHMRAAGILMCIVSNGRSARVRPLAERLGMACLAGAAKPLPFAVSSAVTRLGLERREVAIVGDQIFSDILAGRLAGVYTILVASSCTREPWITAVKRPLERLILPEIHATGQNSGAPRKDR